jgi:hypothetical protein
VFGCGFGLPTDPITTFSTGCPISRSSAEEVLIKKVEFSEVRGSNLRAPPCRGGRISRRLSTMGVTPPNIATNRARKRSKMLRLATLNFVKNFSPAPLQVLFRFYRSGQNISALRMIDYPKSCLKYPLSKRSAGSNLFLYLSKISRRSPKAFSTCHLVRELL